MRKPTYKKMLEYVGDNCIQICKSESIGEKGKSIVDYWLHKPNYGCQNGFYPTPYKAVAAAMDGSDPLEGND